MSIKIKVENEWTRLHEHYLKLLKAAEDALPLLDKRVEAKKNLEIAYLRDAVGDCKRGLR